MLTMFRKHGSFALIASILALVFLVLSSMSREAAAYMVASKLTESAKKEMREKDLSTVKQFLEKKIVLQKLQDFGMTREEAVAKVSQLNDEDLHTLASIAKTSPAGGDGVGVLISLAVLAILVIIILKLLNKEIIIK